MDFLTFSGRKIVVWHSSWDDRISYRQQMSLRGAKRRGNLLQRNMIRRYVASHRQSRMYNVNWFVLQPSTVLEIATSGIALLAMTQ